MAIKTSITISLVEEARGGPFVLWDGVAAGCAFAAELGFDGVEIFAPSPDAVDDDELRGLLEKHDLDLAAVGTGAGMVKHGLSLTDADASKREAARDFVKNIIDWGGPFGAPAIIGSMQGRWTADVDKQTALEYLADALNELGSHAEQYNTPLIYEPLNRYETNLINTVVSGVDLLQTLDTQNVKLLPDLFHMNIEEDDVAQAFRDGKGWVGHVHFVDSTRKACGWGHTDFAPIVAALEEIGYDGYVSAECFAIPTPEDAARQTAAAYKELFK
ncbi:MAG: TIM barrel protein [Planctomycetota bacterium]|jgi:sugar phosphate isomerase/epimerase